VKRKSLFNAIEFVLLGAVVIAGFRADAVRAARISE
jgi:hypothetical protein